MNTLHSGGSVSTVRVTVIGSGLVGGFFVGGFCLGSGRPVGSCARALVENVRSRTTREAMLTSVGKSFLGNISHLGAHYNPGGGGNQYVNYSVVRLCFYDTDLDLV